MKIHTKRFRAMLAEPRPEGRVTISRFVVDSVLGDSLRILRSRLSLPETSLRFESMVEFGAWGREEEFVLGRTEAASMIGVPPSALGERRVFVQHLAPLRPPQVVEVSAEAREVAKKAYARLLGRERLPPEWFLRRSL